MQQNLLAKEWQNALQFADFDWICTTLIRGKFPLCRLIPPTEGSANVEGGFPPCRLIVVQRVVLILINTGKISLFPAGDMGTIPFELQCYAPTLKQGSGYGCRLWVLATVADCGISMWLS